jgi:hypothetical protein
MPIRRSSASLPPEDLTGLSLQPVRSEKPLSGATLTSIEVLESLGRSRVLSRIWVPPEQKERGVSELTEILDAHHLFRALNGKIEGYGISLPQLETEANESGTLIRTDFEQLAPGNFRSPQLGRQTSLGGCRQTIRPVTA